MGRPLRRQVPGQYYLVTIRCHQARFFLRPDHELNSAVLEWLTRAQEFFPDLRILAVCVMSNHLHLVVHDVSGLLAAWASYFFGNLARAVNRLRERTGTCFARRYSAEPILDAEALVDRVVYTATNPVKAGLCAHVGQWPGVVLFARASQCEEISVSWVDRDLERRANARAMRRNKRPVKGETFRETGKLVIDPLPEEWLSPGDTSLIAAIEARETQLAAERCRAGLRLMGVAKVLAQSWRSAPSHPKVTPRPLCHAADSALRDAFFRGYSAFVDFFREAAALLREGAAHVAFPDWSFPPGSPLVRVALTASL